MENTINPTKSFSRRITPGETKSEWYVSSFLDNEELLGLREGPYTFYVAKCALDNKPVKTEDWSDMDFDDYKDVQYGKAKKAVKIKLSSKKIRLMNAIKNHKELQKQALCLT